MGRNRKTGFSYFPFDVDFFQDIRIRKLIKYQGGKAITVYALLLCFIYKDGYYMRWDEELPFIISEQTGYEEVYIQEVLKCCMMLGLFSKTLFEKHQVITSKGIQERYEKICADSRRLCKIDEFNLISSEEIDIYEEEIAVNSVKSTQRKEKKRKEKYFSKEEKIEKEEIREDCVLPASVVRTLGECYEEMANDESWCELFRMEKGRRGLYLDQQELLMEMQDFFGELKCRGEPARTVKDAKAHFSNWINQKIEKRKQNERIQRNAYASKQEANEYAIRSLAEDYQRLHEGVDSTVPKPF